MDAQPPQFPERTRLQQPWPVRLTHWVNIPTLVILAGSGLQIWMAYPYQGPRGELFEWFPLQGFRPPEWMRIGHWLAGARHWHFAFMWLLVLNGLAYLLYLFASGEWRRRFFLPRRDVRPALRAVATYARLRAVHPEPELYNGLQRLAYTALVLIVLVEVLTGLVLYKPLQLRWLGLLFGGYDVARLLHFAGLAALVLLTAGHVLMVLLHPPSLKAMITGGKRG